jgi:hypothetical protein
MATSSCTASSQCGGGGTCSNIGGGRVVSTPAMDCYLTKMGGVANGTGGALAFDSSACYSGGSVGGGSGVNAPAGLTAVVH